MPNVSANIDTFLRSADNAEARTNLGAASLAANTLTGLLQFTGTTHAGIRLNSLTTTQRDALTAGAGDFLFNSTLSQFQGYTGAAWVSMAGLTYNTFTGQQIISANGAASTPPLLLNGTVFTGGSTTTTKPLFLIEPTGTTSTGWSTGGTLLGVNGPSGHTGNYLDIQRNGVSELRVENNGTWVRTSVQFGTGAVNACGISLHGGDNLLFNSDNQYVMKLYSTIMLLQSTCQFGISSGNCYTDTADIGFARTSVGVGRISNGSTGRGTLDAAGYQVGGVAGASFGPGLPTSITVVNGIITAIS